MSNELEARTYKTQADDAIKALARAEKHSDEYLRLLNKLDQAVVDLFRLARK